ncbi:MAG: hypothetical protein QW596_01340 [Sulfolobales archaeon]
MVKCLYSDEEIISSILDLAVHNHLLVSIDAPFSESSGMREVDKKLVSAGFKVLPPGFKYMRLLTSRALKLVERLKLEGVLNVFETHPRSALLSSHCKSVEELIARFCIELGNHSLGNLSKDVKDALIASLVSYCIDNNCYLKFEDVDGVVWLISNVC